MQEAAYLRRAAMDRPRRLESRPRWLATFACLLAIAVRLVLPGLHSHDPAPPHDGCAAAAAPCACGHQHAPRPTTDDDDRARDGDTAVLAACACLACEIELSTPGAPPPLPLVAPRHFAAAPLVIPMPSPRRGATLDRAHPCRAPPPPGRPFVAAARHRAA